MEQARRHKAEWERVNGKRKYPDVRRRYNQQYKLFRYGLTRERFESLLEKQGNACGMCHQLFGDGQAICIDHDHTCCPDEKKSCGDCIRGLLCVSCNTFLGRMETKLDLAHQYLVNPPGGIVRAV